MRLPQRGVAKLLRNLSIAILIPVAAWLTQREEACAAGDSEPVERTSIAKLVPFFVLAFIFFILVRTAGDSVFHVGAAAGGLGRGAPMWQAVMGAGQTASDLFLICGMTAVGLSVSFTDMWRIGWRPLAAGFAIATLVGTCSLLLTLSMLHFG